MSTKGVIRYISIYDYMYNYIKEHHIQLEGKYDTITIFPDALDLLILKIFNLEIKTLPDGNAANPFYFENIDIRWWMGPHHGTLLRMRLIQLGYFK